MNSDQTMQSLAKRPFVAALRNAFWSGAAASVLSGIALVWRGFAERMGALRAINAISHWFWDEEALRKTQPSFRHTLTGAIVHHASSVFWAVFYEYWLQRDAEKEDVSAKKIIGRAASITAFAWITDFYLTPKRLTPGFERVVTKPSLVMTYVAFGCGLSAVALWSAQRKKAQR